MAKPQSAICAETGDFGLFLTLVLNGSAKDGIGRALATLPDLTRQMSLEFDEPRLVSAVAIGHDAWRPVMGGAPPADLVPFQPLRDGDREAPATPADLFLHIHSPRHDANFALARRIVDRLGDAVGVVEEIHGFKHKGGRDLTGFVDGTENAKGDERAGVALVPDGPFVGGSYVSIQRYIHGMRKWESLPVAEQEGVIGRTKETDEELDDTVKPPTAHIARVVIEEDGEELEILRHSLPYGSTGEAGLYFVAYGADPATFRKMLEAMVLADADGHYDHLLDFSRPVTGAAFFAPSLDLLRLL
ncbi:peroxidase [Paramagnetospirillum kuznetsovii]|uniref:Peroxidase n=1 Tax=Paramagnetospirillum kuznetsovii TaxID=2053833 RepID=A0A364NV96_9PROT|nr:Dyp-type peroxidase [Paramagnetospirillum kuznetsovii]RAU21008.1 peroxidase [Paramagnetospirillum kuznetsovii]